VPEIGATEESIKKLEAQFCTPFTDEVCLFWKYFNNFDSVLDFLKFSNVEYMGECYDSVTSCCAQMAWIPINDVDYDFCFNAIDVDTGYLIQIDRECESQHILGPGIIPMLKKYVEELEKAYNANGKQKLTEKWKPDFDYELGSLRDVFPDMFALYRELESGDDYE